MFDKTAKLEKAYRRHPRAPLFARLADACLVSGQVAGALALCEDGVRTFPDYATGHFVLSRCLEAENRLEEAREALDRGLRLDPRCPAPYRQLSRLYSRMGNATLARKCLEAAVQLDPFSESLAHELATWQATEAPSDAAEGAGDARAGSADLQDGAPPGDGGEAAEPFAHVESSPGSGEPEPPPEPEPAAEPDLTPEFQSGPAPLGEPEPRPIPEIRPISAVETEAAAATGEPVEAVATPEPVPPLPADEAGADMPPAVALGQDEVAALGQELAELFDGDAPPLDEPASPGEPAPPDEPVSLDESSSPDESGPPEAPASSATAPAATEGEPPGPVSTQGDDLAPCVPADLGDPADLEPAPVAPAEAAVEVPVGDALSALPATSEIGNLAGDSDIPAPDAATAPAGVAVARLGNGDQELADLVGDLTSGAPESERLEAADAPPPPGSAAAANGGPVPAVPTPTLARLYAEQGFADRAASVYRQVLQARPDDEEARLALAGLEGPR